jgi:hypothetical protein
MGVRAEAGSITMTQVMSLYATAGDDAGEADLSWEPVPGVKSYEIQTSPDPVTATSWAHGGISTKSKATLAGLPSGGLCHFRVRAVGANGAGPWSDSASKRIP